jgi:UDP-N-acetylglucosamine/UDP-N-acetylgalactosamine 4-epimerase
MTLNAQRTWLVTGAAGFIGSNLVQWLLDQGQIVRGLDNFLTGHRRNLDDVKNSVTPEQWAHFQFFEADIRHRDGINKAVAGADIVLHQAAIGSVPRSITDPLGYHEVNVTGFLNMLLAARDAGIRRFVYASSSSVYGDEPNLPKVESRVGSPLSPYAATKAMNETYALLFGQCYGMETVGLRYFNVFGPRQDPNGVYAAVIPKWVSAMIRNETVFINGDGETSRDFCFIANVIQANIKAATVNDPAALNQVYNVAAGERTTLNQLYKMLCDRLVPTHSHLKKSQPVYRDFQKGDVRHSLADIDKSRKMLGYEVDHKVSQGLDEALGWYVKNSHYFV